MVNDDFQSPIVRFGVGLAAVICVMSGPVSGYFLTKIFLTAQASADWPSVVGTIHRAEVGETRAGRYFADVSYTYRVDGIEFTGSNIRASHGEYNIRDGAEQALRGLAVGQELAVFYNPADHKEGYLRPGAGFQEYFLLFVPLAMFVFGIWLFRFLRQTRR